MFSSSIISPLCGGAFLFLPSHLFYWSPHPGVQGEGEGCAEGEGKVEGLALAGQCIAKGQTLGGTGEEETSSHIAAWIIFDYLKIRYSSGRAAQVMLLLKFSQLSLTCAI